MTSILIIVIILQRIQQKGKRGTREGIIREDRQLIGNSAYERKTEFTKLLETQAQSFFFVFADCYRLDAFSNNVYSIWIGWNLILRIILAYGIFAYKGRNVLLIQPLGTELTEKRSCAISVRKI